MAKLEFECGRIGVIVAKLESYYGKIGAHDLKMKNIKKCPVSINIGI